MTTNKNLNYKRGADKERKIVKKAREDGCIAFRSAGSHSPIDVFILDKTTRVIHLIQCKSSIKLKGKIEPRLKEKLEKEWSWLNGAYRLEFKAL